MNKLFFFIIIFLFATSWISAADDLNSQNSVSLETVIAKSKTIGLDNVALTVKGRIKNVNPVYFELDTFMRLKPEIFETTNHWTDKKEKFTGVEFIYLLKFLGIDDPASIVEVIASNNYRISIKINDLKQYGYLLSYKLNDKIYSEHKPKDDKGPIAVAINFDKYPELDREIYKHQLVWFVETIIVK